MPQQLSAAAASHRFHVERAICCRLHGCWSIKHEEAIRRRRPQVLDRTLELLTAQDRNAAANVAAQERQQGVEVGGLSTCLIYLLTALACCFSKHLACCFVHCVAQRWVSCIMNLMGNPQVAGSRLACCEMCAIPDGGNTAHCSRQTCLLRYCCRVTPPRSPTQRRHASLILHRPQGFADVAATLEKISETKSQLDEVKGARLAEISRTVDEINREIKGRKSVLAPRVVELRTKRQEYQVT